MSQSYKKKPQYVLLQNALLQREEDSTSISNIAFVKQEIDYQRTINDKLKSAADWDLKSTRNFGLSCFKG